VILALLSAFPVSQGFTFQKTIAILAHKIAQLAAQ